MKKSKLIIAGTVTLLSVGIVATSVALYSNELNETIHISGEILNSGNYTLSAPEVSNTLGYNTNVTIKSYLGMEVPSTSSYSQDIVGGKVGIEISLPNGESSSGDKDILDFINVTATVEGYTDGTIFDGTSFEFIKNDETNIISSSVETFFKISGDVQYVNIEISVKEGTSETDYLTYVAEKSLSYKITLDETVDYNYAYVVGVDNNWSADDTNIYRMVPNLDKSKNEYEWMFLGFTNETEQKIKVYKDGYFPTDQSGSEITVKPGTHDIYFKTYEVDNFNKIYISNNQ